MKIDLVLHLARIKRIVNTYIFIILTNITFVTFGAGNLQTNIIINKRQVSNGPVMWIALIPVGSMSLFSSEMGV